VVLFVPAEAVLSAALEADPALLEHALGRGVALASPVSLLTLLRTCATAWARTAVNDDARELLEFGRTLYERLGTVAGHLDALGGALRRSVTAYNKAVGSMENRLLVTARSLETLGEQVDSPTLISADAAQARTGNRSRLMLDINGYRADRRTELTKVAQEAVTKVPPPGGARRSRHRTLHRLPARARALHPAVGLLRRHRKVGHRNLLADSRRRLRHHR